MIRPWLRRVRGPLPRSGLLWLLAASKEISYLFRINSPTSELTTREGRVPLCILSSQLGFQTCLSPQYTCDYLKKYHLGYRSEKGGGPFSCLRPKPTITCRAGMFSLSAPLSFSFTQASLNSMLVRSSAGKSSAYPVRQDPDLSVIGIWSPASQGCCGFTIKAP